MRGGGCGASEEARREAVGGRGRGRHDGVGLVHWEEFMKRFGASILIAAAALVCVAPVTRAQNAPVVTVLAFDNAAFGPGAKDYDGIGKGVMDLLIMDLASAGKVRVVDRERIQNILDEQKLTSSGAVDGATAVRVGKLLGACYSIYGSFMRDQRTGNNTITLHTTSNETGQIGNGQKIESKGDDIMGLIAQASAKFISMMDVKACPGGMSRSSSAEPAQQAPARSHLSPFRGRQSPIPAGS